MSELPLFLQEPLNAWHKIHYIGPIAHKFLAKKCNLNKYITDATISVDNTYMVLKVESHIEILFPTGHIHANIAYHIPIDTIIVIK